MQELSFSQMEETQGGSKLGCALAIAGTIGVTVGGAFVTGGASLIVFLACKGIATAAIIEACSDL